MTVTRFERVQLRDPVEYLGLNPNRIEIYLTEDGHGLVLVSAEEPTRPSYRRKVFIPIHRLIEAELEGGK